MTPDRLSGKPLRPIIMVSDRLNPYPLYPVAQTYEPLDQCPDVAYQRQTKVRVAFLDCPLSYIMAPCATVKGKQTSRNDQEDYQ